MSGSRRLRWFSGFAVVMVLAGCGSTVPAAQRQLGANAGRAGGGVESATANGVTGGTSPVDAAAASGAQAAGRSTTRSAVRGTTLNGAKPGALGPGVSPDKINIGLVYAVNSSAANTAIGASGISQGDPKSEYRIVIDDINAHGGVAGRKLEGIYHEIDGASTASYNTTDQQTCDGWTQDNKVFAALREGSETLMQCLQNRNVVLIGDDLTGNDAATFTRYPYYVEISSMNLDRMATAQVAGLSAQGYFSGWNAVSGQPAATKAKVGIVSFDSPPFRHAVEQSLVPALRTAGYAPAPADIVLVAPVAQTSDTGTVAAAVSSAVLKLRSDNVTHVIVFDERGLLTLFFLQNSDSQGYRPRYGMNTQNGPQALKDGAALPARQLIGLKGIGWLPSLDLPSAKNPRNGPYSNDARRRCIALLESKGVTFKDVNAESIAMGICNSLWLFRDAVKASGNVLNRDGFMAGVAKLGTSFQSASNFAIKFSASQHDGVAAYRYYVWDQAAGEIRYDSGNIAAP